MKFKESLNIEFTLETPAHVTASEVTKVFNSARWTYSSTLAFDVTGKVVSVTSIHEAERDDGYVTWSMEVAVPVELVPWSPLPPGQYSSSDTRGFLQAEPELPEDWQITETCVH